jgi:hypothetical protein
VFHTHHPFLAPPMPVHADFYKRELMSREDMRKQADAAFSTRLTFY